MGELQYTFQCGTMNCCRRTGGEIVSLYCLYYNRVARYPDMFLIFREDKKTIVTKGEKEGTFTEVTIDAILCGE